MSRGTHLPAFVAPLAILILLVLGLVGADYGLSVWSPARCAFKHDTLDLSLTERSVTPSGSTSYANLSIASTGAPCFGPPTTNAFALRVSQVSSDGTLVPYPTVPAVCQNVSSVQACVASTVNPDGWYAVLVGPGGAYLASTTAAPGSALAHWNLDGLGISTSDRIALVAPVSLTGQVDIVEVGGSGLSGSCPL